MSAQIGNWFGALFGFVPDSGIVSKERANVYFRKDFSVTSKSAYEGANFGPTIRAYFRKKG